MIGLLANLLSLAVPSPIAKLAERARPNPYAPAVPDQIAIAQSQQVGRGLRGGLAGDVGSEADYATAGQAAGGRPVQELPSARRPPAYYALARGIHGDPAAGPEPTTLADFDRAPQGNQEPWGGSTRTVNNGAQSVRAATLLDPLYRSPNARQMVTGRTDGIPAGAQDALDSAWSG